MFDLTFLGASGGPVEGTTCSLLIKPSHIDYNAILSQDLKDQLLCVDAGSGLHQLSEAIYQEKALETAKSSLLSLYDDTLPLQDYVKSEVVVPFAGLYHPKCPTPFSLAWKVLSMINNYLITHPHLDHVAALALNSAGFDPTEPTKTVIGSDYTLGALQKYIFNGIIWPNMPSFDVLSLSPREFWLPFNVGDHYKVTMLDLSHGKINFGHQAEQQLTTKLTSGHDNPSSPYTSDDTYISSAFLIEYLPGNGSVLVFGDFESDSVSKQSRNLRIWSSISPLIINHTLRALVLECSMCTSSSNSEKLYGHLMPLHLIKELQTLESQCKHLDPTISQPLNGLQIIVNHVKESPHGIHDPRRRVLQSLDTMNEEHGLGVKFSIALGGVTIRV
ncbi:3',5'-cyclic-nucleotide phosphodiesterase 1 [[Candida] anglica]|uniref:3',5'-cyclic-nucleotide phosphodiesterase 1 n=1 Tax=[Candida] anglica TaxID=148631 RepID=A0ABP0ELK8_9ASCO